MAQQPPKLLNLSASRWAPASERRQNQYQYQHQQQLTTISISSKSEPKSLPTNDSDTTSSQALSNPAPVPSLSTAQRQLLAREQDFERFAKLLRRLKWKCSSLVNGHQRALRMHQLQQPAHAHPSPQLLGQDDPELVICIGMTPDEAETMFKIDFFEFYVLLERVLVHLLGVFGMVIAAERGVGDTTTNTPAVANSNGGTTGGNGIIGDSRIFHGYAHRFHANVLAALENPKTSLHEILGQGTVIEYLRMAKEFRNRWKDVDERRPEEDGESEEEWWRRKVKRYEKVMKDLRLEQMLACILDALDRAGALGEEELRKGKAILDGNANGHEYEQGLMELDMEDAEGEGPWEAMPDAMEWD